MIRIALIAALIAASSPIAMAQLGGLTSNGQLRMYITDDGVGTVTNWTSEPARFDGYTVHSATGLIDPANWIRLSTQAMTDPGFPATIGQSAGDAMAWIEMAGTADEIGEVHFTSAATLMPGDTFTLGAAFSGDWFSDLTFNYVDSIGGESWDNTIWPAPFCNPTPPDLGGPYLWDIAANATLQCASPDPTFMIEQWSILEHPLIPLEAGPNPVLSWADLRAAGLTPGEYTLQAGGFTTCGGWTEDIVALTIVPEPATASLLAFGALALVRRRRR